MRTWDVPGPSTVAPGISLGVLGLSGQLLCWDKGYDHSPKLPCLGEAMGAPLCQRFPCTKCPGEKTFKMSSPGFGPLDHPTECHVCSVPWTLPGMVTSPLPWAVPMLSHSSSEGIFPNLHPEPSLVQFETVSPLTDRWCLQSTGVCCLQESQMCFSLPRKTLDCTEQSQEVSCYKFLDLMGRWRHLDGCPDTGTACSEQVGGHVRCLLRGFTQEPPWKPAIGKMTVCQGGHFTNCLFKFVIDEVLAFLP